jgi:hypothetical protein
MIFVELPAFAAQALFDDAALLALQLTLMADPLTFAYAKSRQSNLTPKQTRVLAEVLREVLKHE